MPNRRVVAVAYDGLCAFEFGVAAELFGLPRPELDVEWYEFSVVSVDPGPLRTLGGLTLAAPTDLSAVATAGTVVLPGWRDPGEEPPPELLDALRAANANGARLLSICSGVFVLAATGLLDGLAATTHWRYTERLQAAHPTIDVRPGVLYVDNGSLLTSAGSAAGLDLGLHLIRRDHGAAVANRVARRLVLSPQRAGGQAQFIADPVPPDPNASLATTMDWIQERLDRPLTVAEMAANANLSARTFARRFRSEIGLPPHRWLVTQRVAAAKRLLETTDASVDVIAARCGFGSGATLRHHFQREASTTPSAYRASFGSSRPSSALSASSVPRRSPR
ncbi:MAG: transcriptional regulator FtrA [Actinomycetota bacterium]